MQTICFLSYLSGYQKVHDWIKCSCSWPVGQRLAHWSTTFFCSFYLEFQVYGMICYSTIDFNEINGILSISWPVVWHWYCHTKHKLLWLTKLSKIFFFPCFRFNMPLKRPSFSTVRTIFMKRLKKYSQEKK